MALAIIGQMAGTAHADISITNLGQSYTQDFNTLTNQNTGTFTWADNSTLEGWYRRSNVNNSDQTPDPDLVDYAVKGDQVGLPGFYNVSTAGNSDRAVGFRINGQPTGLKKGSVGVIFTNETGSTIQSFDVSYRGEHWYRTVNDTTLVFQWRVVDSFADINTDIDRAQEGWSDEASPLAWSVPAAAGSTWQNGTTAANSTNLSATVSDGVNLSDGQLLILRWRVPLTGGQEHGLFIDDVVVDNFLTAAPLVGASNVVMFGGSASVLTGDVETNNAFITQIGAGEIVQWNGVNSDGGGFGASGTLANESVGASLTNSANNLVLTTTAISSSNIARTNTVQSGGQLGVNSADGAANFQQSDATEWSFEFNKRVNLKQVIYAGLDIGAKDRMRVNVNGVDYDLSPADTDETDAWSGAGNTEVYTFPTSVTVSVGADITISTHDDQESPDAINNKWGLFSVVVDIPDFNAAELYNAWLGTYPSLGSDTNLFDNPDNDELDNLSEYALGGDPTKADGSGLPTYSSAEEGGTNYFDYVYSAHADAAERGLSYEVELDDDLVLAPGWTNVGYEVINGEVSDGFRSVTNRVTTDGEPRQFFKLNIELN